jgi:REP element-mobilizing transposase RayT
MTYNPNIHHRRSIRLQGYDYSQAGLYFITICCQNRAYLFGNVINGKMKLNIAGEIAHNEWIKTTEIRNNVELGEFVVMPNHFHAIVRLTDRGELHSPEITGELHSPGITNELHLQSKKGAFNAPPQGPSQTIGAIVRGYKSAVTKQLNLLNIGCVVWQRNYHEHIIRNEQSFQRISKYIINNPANWNDDKFIKPDN